MEIKKVFVRRTNLYRELNKTRVHGFTLGEVGSLRATIIRARVGELLLGSIHLLHRHHLWTLAKSRGQSPMKVHRSV
jgi:hypothetical protein